MKRLKILAALLLLLFFSSLVKANHEGEGKKDPILEGCVSDAFSRKPVRGVTIFVTSSKSQLEKSFITDAYGNFKIPKLSAGEVTIILEKKGYKTYRRENVIIKEGIQIRLNFDMNEEENNESKVFHPLLRMMES